MDTPKKVFSGDVKDIKSVLDNTPKDFRGVLRLNGKSKNRLFEADLLLQNGLVIAASRRFLSNNETVYGEEAYKEIAASIKKGSGTLDLYGLSEEEFRGIVEEEDDILLEDVKDISDLLGGAKKDEKPAAERDELEDEWDKLEDEWEKYDLKDKKYFDAMLGGGGAETKARDEKASELLDFELIRDEVKEELSHHKEPEEKEEAQPSEEAVVEEETEEEKAQEPVAPEIHKVIDIAPEPPEEEPEPLEQPKPVPQAPVAQQPPAPEQPKPSPEEKSSAEKFIEQKSAEIQQLKKNVEVYWGWDDKKKQFVGMEKPFEEKKPEPALVQQQQPQTEEEKKEAAFVPSPMKKIGFRDKLFYLTTPKIIRVLERIDGKRSLDSISKETGIPMNEIKFILEQLRKDGYLPQ